MGLNDAAEMLEAAKQDIVRLERENAELRALLEANHVAYMQAVTR